MASDLPTAFEGIDPRLAAAVGRRGIRELSEIQRLAFPVLRGESDALLLSPTGTGKTEAALLPLLSRRLSDPSPPISILYVTPLRALNRDLEHRLVALVEEVGLTAAVRHGDTTAAARVAQSRTPPDLLLTTPETLQILMVGVRLREGLRNVRTVVVDEIHELVGSDRGAQLGLTLERLDALAGRKVRRIGLSATVGNPSEVARFLAPVPRVVEVQSAQQRRVLELSARSPADTYPALEPRLQAELKADEPLLRGLRAVEEEVRAHTTTLIFVNTRPTAEGLAARLSRLAPDLAIAVHHGSLSREVREEAEHLFREGKLKALVATSSLELGIDIGSVDHVIQFGSPHQVGRLVQRVGRSGHRLDRTIHGTVLALDDDDLEEAAVLARRADEGLVEPASWRTRNRLAAAQQVVASLRADGAVAPSALVATLGHAAAVADLSESEWTGLFDYLVALRLARRLDDGRLAPGRGTLARFYASLSLIPDERTYRLRDIDATAHRNAGRTVRPHPDPGPTGPDLPAPRPDLEGRRVPGGRALGRAGARDRCRTPVGRGGSSRAVRRGPGDRPHPSGGRFRFLPDGRPGPPTARAPEGGGGPDRDPSYRPEGDDHLPRPGRRVRFLLRNAHE